MEENILLAKEIYGLLRSTYNTQKESVEQGEITIENLIKILFHTVDGKVYMMNKSEKSGYYGYDGIVDKYTIGGSVKKDYMDGDFNRLIEDLTMACYKNSGGKEITYTPKLIDTIRKL